MLASLLNELRTERIRLGFTQMDLANKTGLSLPLIQKLEAGAGNPSLDTLQKISHALGWTMEWGPKLANWDALVACGAALAKESKEFYQPSLELLVDSLRMCCRELNLQKTGNERKQEVIEALLLALKIEYPGLYDRIFKKIPVINNMLIQKWGARHIKLKRISAQVLTSYL